MTLGTVMTWLRRWVLGRCESAPGALGAIGRSRVADDLTRRAVTQALDTRQFSVEQQIREIYNDQVARKLFEALAARETSPKGTSHGD